MGYARRYPGYIGPGTAWKYVAAAEGISAVKETNASQRYRVKPALWVMNTYDPISSMVRS